MNVVDGVGDTYTLYAEPQKKDSNNADNTLAVVAVFLSQRGNKTPSDRERLRFTFEQSVPVSQLAAALDAAWQRTHEWITQAGHSRGNA